MAEIRVEPGDMFHKSGVPSVVWVVDDVRRNAKPVHVVLVRRDDPLTRISVSLGALMDRKFFRRLPMEPRTAPRSSDEDIQPEVSKIAL